jgi:hypothetical protein
MNTYFPNDFVKVCAAGKLNVAQHILQNNPNYDFYYKLQLAFNSSCKNGHLNVAQWLLTVPNNLINIRFGQNENFKWACGYGHINVAQWLYNIISHALSDNEKYELCKEAFTYSCGNGYLDVTRWLFNEFCCPLHWITDDCFVTNCKRGRNEVAQWICSLMPFKYSIQERLSASGYPLIDYRINTDKGSNLLMVLYLLSSSNYTECLVADIVFNLKEVV